MAVGLLLEEVPHRRVQDHSVDDDSQDVEGPAQAHLVVGVVEDSDHAQETAESQSGYEDMVDIGLQLLQPAFLLGSTNLTEEVLALLGLQLESEGEQDQGDGQEDH